MECKKTKAEIEQAIKDSIREEESAIAAYAHRAKETTPKVSKLYKHIKKQELEHVRELKDALKKL